MLIFFKTGFCQSQSVKIITSLFEGAKARRGGMFSLLER